MANLYNKAGLVNIPVGYKDGFLYNIKPIDDTLAFRFNRNSAATRVNEQGLIETVGVDEPRIDYTDSLTSPALLLEPQRSNYLKNNEDLQGDGWSNIGGLTLEFNQDDPFGGSNAVKMTDFNDINDRYDFFTTKTGVNGETVTYSGYYKGSGTIRIGLNTGTGIGGSTEIDINLTDEWVRHEITVKFTSAVTGNYRAHTAITRTTNNDAVVYLSYPQIEVGSYATSIIKTEGSTVTRATETCNGAGNASTFNDSEGVLYAEIAALADNGTFRLISLDGGHGNDLRLGYRNTSNAIYYQVRSGDVSQAFQIYTTTDVKQFHKVAVLYQQNNFKLFINGVNVLSDPFGITPVGLNDISFDLKSNALFYGKVKSLAVFNEALTDEELQQLTS